MAAAGRGQQDSGLLGLGCLGRASWTWGWDRAEVLSAPLLPAVLDAGDGQTGACPSLQHGRRVPAHRRCLNTARDARAKCSEGGGWERGSADATASSPGPAWANCRAAGSCQKGMGQAGEVSKQQHCQRVQPHWYHSKRKVQGMGGSREAAAATLPSPWSVTTTALPLPCLPSQDHRCHWGRSLGIPGGAGGSRHARLVGLRPTGSPTAPQPHSPTACAGGCPIAPSPVAHPRAGRGQAGRQCAVGWLLPGPSSRTHGSSSEALRAGGRSYCKTGVRTGAGLG